MDNTRLYFVRHGQVVGHEERRFNGHTDVDLTSLGRKQMKAVAEDLAGVELEAVYSSDLKRARFGGEALVKSRGLELRIEPAFRELGFGEWEGMSSDEINECYPGEIERRYSDFINYRIPGGETIQEFTDRVGARLWQILTEHKGSAVALVAHSGVNRAILLQALGCGPGLIWRFDQDFGCLNIIDFFGNGAALIKRANGPNRFQGL